MRLLLAALLLTTACAAQPKRIQVGVRDASFKNSMVNTREAAENLMSKRFYGQMAVEIHVRGTAVRCSITGREIDLLDAKSFAISLINVFSMYYRDIMITVNDHQFRLVVPAPDDGSV